MKRRAMAPTALGLFSAVVVLGPMGVASASPITFTDIARDGDTGITYRRGASATKALADAVKLKPFMSMLELTQTPQKPAGAPGVAVFDADGDGDLDVYVPNGPDRPNSLYQNQLVETGDLTFIDVAAAAGVDATDQDSTGVCYGDIDNDGDQDLMVNGRMEPSRLFRNEADGTFAEITGAAGVGGGSKAHTSCAMGDVNNDGLLDIFVANTFDWSRNDAIFTDSFSFNQPNELWINQDGGTFTDGFDPAGLNQLFGVPPGDATITWSAALVDYDLDGDVDLFHADDQGAMAPSFFAGVNRGYMQLFANDGAGNFTNRTAPAGLTIPSSWMGFSFGDLNTDGHMDFFSPSVGDYLIQQMGIPTPPGYSTSKWFLGSAGGAFTGPGVGALGVTPFGWGNAFADVDNDGDTDIVFYGGLDVGPFMMLDNPGVVLLNDGEGNFSWDQAATASSSDFVIRQDTHGLAMGDLNDDGFVDMVHVGASSVPSSIPLVPASTKWGSVFDATAFVAPIYLPIGPLEWEWAGRDMEEGYLSVDVSSADNGNKWVKVRTVGAAGLVSGAQVNRDGIGAVLFFKPRQGKQVMSPVLGGSSYASQHALEAVFGLGNKNKGTLEVLWPGGARNRLYDVVASERVTLPEIPCDFTASWPSRNHYRGCVEGALDEIVAEGLLPANKKNRFKQSAMRAYDDEH